MTEAEWLACADPKRMLDFLNQKNKASPRKLRLLVCAWVREIWNDVIRYGPEYCVWMDAAERYLILGRVGASVREEFHMVRVQSASAGAVGNQAGPAVSFEDGMSAGLPTGFSFPLG